MAKQNNVKTVYAIRHGKQINVEGMGVWQTQAVLSPDAEAQIAKAAEYLKTLGVEFKVLRYSPLVRAKQTCEKLQQKMGSAVVATECAKLAPDQAGIEEWDRVFGAYLADPKNPQVISNTEVFERWPDICTRDGGRVLEAINETAGLLEVGETAAVFGHNPLFNVAEVMTGKTPKTADLKHLQAIAFIYNERNELVRCKAHLI